MGRLGKFTIPKWAGKIAKTALSIVTIITYLLGSSNPTNQTETPPQPPVQAPPGSEQCSSQVTGNGNRVNEIKGSNQGEINFCVNKQTNNFLNENFWLSSSSNHVDVAEQGQINIASFIKTGETMIDLSGTSNPTPSITVINFSIGSPGLSQYLSLLLPQQSASSQSAPSINEPSGDRSGWQLVESGDTFFKPWTLTVKPGTSLSGFLLSGLPGKTAFTRKSNFLEGTPSSAISSDFTLTSSSNSSVGRLVTDGNLVALDGNPPSGDTFTDLRWPIQSVPDPVHIPEPSAGAEAVLLVLGFGWLTKRKMK